MKTAVLLAWCMSGEENGCFIKKNDAGQKKTPAKKQDSCKTILLVLTLLFLG